MKLKTKIQLFSSLFMLLLIVLVNTSIYYLFYHLSADNELEELVDETNAIAETLQSNPDIPQNELLHAFVPSDGLIRIIDEEGNELIPTITKRQAFLEIPASFSESESREISRVSSGDLVAAVEKPIIWEDGKVVTLQVANYLLTLQETMRTLFYVLVAASIIMLLPSVIAGNILSKFILRPIKQLIETMKENTREEKWKTIEIDGKSKDELYEMENTFNEMIAHLKDNFQKQEEFVSDASHELKTPISIIKSYAELLKRRGKSHPEVYEESVDAIDTEADRMQQLVNQLLALAKNKQSVVSSKLDIVDLVEKTAETFREAYERNIEFQAEESNVFVEGNKEQLEQIIYILLSNAIQYSDKEIMLSVLVHRDDVELHIMDKGPGISSEDQKRIFDRFYRIDEARTRTSGGTGLGLAIAKSIATTHGGDLTVKSEKGKGSTFMLRLPIVKEN